MIEYLYDNYIKKDSIFRKPAVLEEEDQTEGNSLIEDKKGQLQQLDLKGKFERRNIVKSLEDRILKKLKEHEKKNTKTGFNFAKNFSAEEYREMINFANELNWELFTSESVYSFKDLAEDSIQYFTSDSFFQKLAEHFDGKIGAYEADPKKNAKFATPRHYYDNFTIEQLDKFNQFFRAKSGRQIMDEDENFVSSYFSKIFSSELSQESQEFMNDEEKFQNLETLYLYAKNKKLPDSLKQMLLYEVLLVSIKLEDYKEDLFKEYIKLPKEENYNLKRKQAQSSV